MKFIYHITLAIFIAFLLHACSQYQPPKTYDVVKEGTFEQPYDQVWNSAIQWFAMSGNPVKNMDKESGFISTDYNLSASQSGSCDCGSAGANLFARQQLTNTRGNFNLLIKKVDDTHTKVTVNCFFKTTSQVVFNDGDRTAAETIDCVSTGYLEKEILSYIGNN